MEERREYLEIFDATEGRTAETSLDPGADSSDGMSEWRRGAFLDLLIATSTRARLGMALPLDAACMLLGCADTKAKEYLGEVAALTIVTSEGVHASIH